MNVDWLIVGAGFTGATLAERIASQLDKKVLVLDRRNHVGGNAYDRYDDHGILVSEYGPHIFHTSSQRVWDYLSRFTRWIPYFHRVLASVDGHRVPVPFNLNSLHALFPGTYAHTLESLLIAKCGLGAKVPVLRLRESDDPQLKELANYIYEKVFYGYTVKQWELRPEELDPGVTGRVPIHVSRDDRYFQDTYQAMPALGYTELFKRMLDHKNIRIMLNTGFDDIAGEVEYGRMVYTGPIDSYFGYKHGELPYRSLRFEFNTLDKEYEQEVGTVNYPNDYAFTRITEQKHLTGQRHEKTTLITEYPQRYERGVNEAYYPIPRDENRERYALYARDAAALDGRVLFAGRLADYKYYNMDQAVARALSVFDKAVVPLTEGRSIAAVEA